MKKPLFTSMKTRTVREHRGQPELTHGQRVESDRAVVDMIWQEIEGSSLPYRKAKARAIKQAAESLHRDDSVIRRTWARWEPFYLAWIKLRGENQGKVFDE